MDHATNNTTWGVIGGGNGGQAIAGYLGSLGFSVHLHDILPENVNAINKQGGVYLKGKINSFGKVSANLNIEHTITSSNIILVVTPAFAHKQIAKQCKDLLKEDQTIVIVPGSTGGAIEFYNEIKQSTTSQKITIAETQSLFYACRIQKPGTVNIYGIKNELLLSALPSTKTDIVINKMKNAFPQIIPATNVLETSFENVNAILHPLPALLNAGRIENKDPFLYYMDGITPAISNLIESIDNERIQIGKSLGLTLRTTNSWLKTFYQIEGNTIFELVRSNDSYKTIQGPQILNNRFFLEDIPMGLIPMLSFAKKFEVPVPNMQAVIQLSTSLLGEAAIKNKRTLENLGLNHLSKNEILNFINNG